MENTFLTSDEIYAIEDMTEDRLLDFVALFTPAKKEDNKRVSKWQQIIQPRDNTYRTHNSLQHLQS